MLTQFGTSLRQSFVLDGIASYLSTMEGKSLETFASHLIFLRELIQKGPNHYWLIRELSKSREEGFLPDDTVGLFAAKREIESYLAANGGFSHEAFQKYHITRSLEGDRHFFLIQDKETQDSEDPIEVKVEAPFIEDPGYFLL
ncbi:MAG: hypothetical protein K8R69_02135 [Deltaproteobacteria bacterium]|nr:hypothetical protein [Deltaproteobacteria bacterium]